MPLSRPRGRWNAFTSSLARPLSRSLPFFLSLGDSCQALGPSARKILIINWQIFNVIACDTPTLVIIALRPCANEINAFIAPTN